MEERFDILVVGGGINGTAIARDAAGRGARVMLVEQDDLAGHTSSASTKLIHGGLRYLEQYEFRMVAKALAEREVLMRSAPHLIRPLQFILPHDEGLRPRWMMRAGLLLYDMLGGLKRSLPGSRAVRLDKAPQGMGLKCGLRHGYSYSDCWGDDSRLVVTNARDAADRGATIWTRTALLNARRQDSGWLAQIRRDNGEKSEIKTRILVNATGAWAGRFLHEQTQVTERRSLRLVKGSHIVTRRLFEGDHAYILQNPDGRIVFAIPYEEDFTLIGTTDVDWQGPLDHVSIDAEETVYLCRSVNRWLFQQITPDDVIWSYAGLRPLYDDATANPSEISRDYVLRIDEEAGQAPVLSVFGGKITTHRALAEEAMDKLAPYLPDMGPHWTRDAKLPGGDLGARGVAGLIETLSRQAPFLDERTVRRLAHSYGDRALEVLGDATCAADLGVAFGAGLTEAEALYLIKQEWAASAQDILWRRSKLGLHMRPDEIARFTAWLEKRQSRVQHMPEERPSGTGGA